MATDKDLNSRKGGKATFRRTRFLASVLLSAPVVAFVYSPLLVALTVAGIAVPFATGRFIDAIVGGEIAVLGLAGMLAVRGEIPVGDVVVYQMLFLTAMQSVQGIFSLLPETATLREGIDSLDEGFSRKRSSAKMRSPSST